MAFNILIVDDSSTMRDVVKKTIRMSGFDLGEIFEASDGSEALTVLEKEWADVILSDVRMPGMDGLAFLKALQKEGMISRTPVVMVTTEARQERIDELMGLGAKACIQKPFKPEDIKRTLMRVLDVDEVSIESKGAADGSDF